MKKTIFAIALCITLAGCQTMAADSVMKEWPGKQESQVIEAYGAPDSTYKVSKNEKVISYNSSGGVGMLTPNSNGPLGLAVSGSCRINFIINSGVVKKMNYVGRCYSNSFKSPS